MCKKWGEKPVKTLLAAPWNVCGVVKLNCSPEKRYKNFFVISKFSRIFFVKRCIFFTALTDNYWLP